MPSIILGTGASEAVPCIYCDCPICRHAREEGGHDIRTRSDFLVDETSIIDFSPDLFFQTRQCGITLRKLKNIFITHFHDDHVNVQEMAVRGSGRPLLDFPVSVYGSPAALEHIRRITGLLMDHTHENPTNFYAKYLFRPLEPYREITADGLRVTPVLSSHYGYGVNEIGYNYIITGSNNITFLYAVDTGWFPDETWGFFEKFEKPLDYAVMECTYGDQYLPPFQQGHLNLANLKEMAEKMAGTGLITKTTPIYLTHISHLHSKTHEETEELLKNCGWNLIAGYDGMVIDRSPLI